MEENSLVLDTPVLQGLRMCCYLFVAYASFLLQDIFSSSLRFGGYIYVSCATNSYVYSAYMHMLQAHTHVHIHYTHRCQNSLTTLGNSKDSRY